ncbi:hypothetical protein [Geodermatophilus sp. SYSU D00696]
MSTSTHQTTGRVRRGRLLAWSAAALTIGLAVAALFLTGGRGDDGGPGGTDAAATSSAAVPTTASDPTTPGPAEPSATPQPTGPTTDADELPPGLPPVPLDSSVTVDDDVAVTLEGIEAIEGSGLGPGNVGGPALRITVRFDNRTADAVDLSGVAVDLSYGTERVPGSPLDDPSAASVAGMLEPGETAEGVYVFGVPTETRDTVTVSVGYQPGAPYAVFTGSAA